LASRVGKRGEIVIEKPLREALGVQPGFVTAQTLVDDHIEIRFYPPEHNRSLRGVLERYVTRDLSTEEFREAKERAWAEAVTKDWNSQDSES